MINLPIPVSKEKIDLQIDTAGTWYLIASYNKQFENYVQSD